MTFDEVQDRRTRKTRMAIFDAIRDLALSRRYDEIRIADILERADVGRSTFYEHFRNKDDVLLSSITPLFEILSDVATGMPVYGRDEFVFAHFWENRALGRIIFQGPLGEKLTRKLAAMILAKTSAPQPGCDDLAAYAKAHSMLGAVRAWICSDFSASPEQMAAYFRQ